MKKILILCCFLGSLFCMGCASNYPYNRSYEDEIHFSGNWWKEFVKIKDPNLYKSKLEEQVHYYLYPEYSKKNRDAIFAKASELKMVFLRLCVLEDILGNQQEADIYLRKARYWDMVMNEHGWNTYTPKYINKSVNKITKENARKWITKLSPDFVKRLETLAKAKKEKKPTSSSPSEISLQKN